MTCALIADLLPAYLDRELRGAEAQMVGNHLAGCAACRAVLLEWTALDGRVAMLRLSLPADDIATDVMRRIAAQPRRQSGEAATWVRRSVLAAASLALVVLAILAASFSFAPGGRFGGQPASAGRVYILRQEPAGALAALDEATLSEVWSLPIGAVPHGAIVGRDGRWMYVVAGLPDVEPSDQGRLAQTGVWVVDLVKQQVVDVIAVGYALWDVAAGPKQGQVFVTHQPTGRYVHAPSPGPDMQSARRLPGQVLRVDVAKRQSTPLADLLPLPRALVVSPDGRQAYALSHDPVDYDESVVTVVDLTSRRVVKTIPLPGTEALAMAPDGRRVYVASLSEPYIWVIDCRSLDVTAYRVDGLAPGAAVRGLAVSADSSLLALALEDADNSLVVLTTRTMTSALAVATPAGYQAVAFSADQQRLYAASTTGRLDVFSLSQGISVSSVEGVGRVREIIIP